LRLWEGKKILIVEDEAMVSVFLEDALQEIGCIVVGVAARAGDATAIIDSQVLDAAILDVNLGSGTSHDIARILQRKGVPFIFATGYGSAGAPAEFAGVPFLTKPFTEDEVAQALELVFDAV